ncbi:pyruvate dehydrogenase E1 component [Klebsiella michiganensis]|nr:pyruvate dehydrogenase E1 component [Klebsiella michiganensis]
MSERLPNDVDPIETRDWLQAIESVIREEGVERAQYLIDQLLSEARKGGVKVAAGASTGGYVNTIAVEDEPEYRVIWIWNVVSVLRSAGTRL